MKPPPNSIQSLRLRNSLSWLVFFSSLLFTSSFNEFSAARLNLRPHHQVWYQITGIRPVSLPLIQDWLLSLPFVGDDQLSA